MLSLVRPKNILLIVHAQFFPHLPGIYHSHSTLPLIRCFPCNRKRRKLLLQAITLSINFFRNKSSGLLLFASETKRDPERRNVFAWTGNIPDARELTEQMWDLIEEPQGYLIKNVEYGEYLYAGADDLAFDENNRSVFTWKNRADVGLEGYWKIAPAICPGIQC